MTRRFNAQLGLIILLVLFFAINILAATSLRRTRVDLTENRLYTLSEGSRNVAKKIGEPVKLTLYFSEKLAVDLPTYSRYGRRVRELLEEYARISNGNITLEIVDPEPFSESEDQAVQAGVSGVPISSGESFYLGLVGTNSTDGREVLPFLSPAQEQFLEYEISRLIYTLAYPKRTVVGVVSSLPIEGGPPNPMMGTPQGTPQWQIMRELRALFEVQTLGTGFTEVPDGVDVLLVVHPKTLSPEATYAIDQFMLAGGRAVILVDPHCEADEPPAPMRQNPMQAMQYDRSSNLSALFGAWGIEFDIEKLSGDLQNAQVVEFMAGQRAEKSSYLVWLGLGPDEMDPDDAVTGRLRDVNLATPGFFSLRDDAPVTWSPLIRTSIESQEIEKYRVSFMPDVKGLLSDFAPSGKEFVLAARITGKVPTAFPDGPPQRAEAAEEEEVSTPEADKPQLMESTEPINAVILADVDMLADRFWIQEQRLGPLSLGYAKLADNGDFIINAIENLAGSSDLIQIRARGRFARPFDKVNEIRRDAETKYLAEERDLQEKLRETEAKINELQSSRDDSAEFVLTPEQLAEVERFKEERVETRRQLRNVQLNLRKDIERLGTKLKVINIGLVPLLVALGAVGIGLYRSSRRRAAVKSG